MNIIPVKDSDELSSRAASFILKVVKENPKAVLGLATGNTPLGTYRELVQDHRINRTSYSEIVTINLDEYVGIPKEHPNSYHYFMESHLFNFIDINREQTFIPNGMASDLHEECQKYDQIIRKYPIDLQVLGIGENGHIGFNEPGTSFKTHTHVVTLTESTRHANRHFFQTTRDVPTQAITMGIQSILKSKEILLLASGKKKAKAIEKLMTCPIDETFPASILKTHPNVTLIVDEEASLSYVKSK
ncbi:glucosamine-6-phosphate deaminase [Pullulanibacillus sp. KACC 23026]|uniref:glucosamine-6-phosphate deaminase n=1 Tax=Pullulanibacillus sp. KACC 23026 TaxID=3028315 RepID=UPI0023AFAAC2|nr:glucosamine-6-phosphate deaminase [Pullulanibacillus sp. KACC 23026]WEG14790.1 glucosamine-6-phosphate deaminase [Pullulanibacillus sp. KACC 23026]